MKRIIKSILILLIIFTTLNVSAKTPTTYNREELDNNGVNKKWKITEKNINNVKNTKSVDAKELMYDFSGVLTEEEYDTLQAMANEFVSKTKMDVVILIDELPYISDKENEDYAADFYDYNDFGIDFDKYSGVLLFRNTYEDDPYYDIYTFGNAQLYFDYDRLNYILDDIYPDLSTHNYLDGFTKYIDELSFYYDSGIALNDFYVDDNGYLHKIYIYPFLLLFVISTIVTAIVMAILIGKNKMVKKATAASEYKNKNLSKITERSDIFLSTHTSSYTVSSSSGGGGGGHSSSSGSSGGGHSSGGGRHG